MAEFVHLYIEPYFNYWVYVIIMLIGLWALIAKKNLIKKLIGLSIFQTAIILLYVSIGVKDGATIPILGHHGHTPPAGEHRLFNDPDNVNEEEVSPSHKADDKEHHSETGDKHHAKKDEHEKHGEEHAHHDDHHGHGKHAEINPDVFANPLPHVLMLTAIVVGVATLGVALSITQVVFREFGTLEEDEILAEIKSSGSDG